MEPVKIVAHFIEDLIVKGYANGFDPTYPSFNLYKGNNDSSLHDRSCWI